MGRTAVVISLTPQEQAALSDQLDAGGAGQRKGERVRMILLAAQGRSTIEIARALGTRPARVSKWRQRFARFGLAGLEDLPRPGRPRRYGAATEERVLARLRLPPPDSRAVWNGRLLAEAVGDVSPNQIWRILRRHGITLERARRPAPARAPVERIPPPRSS